VRLDPHALRLAVEQLAVAGRQILAFANEQHMQNAIALFADGKTYSVGVPLGRQTAAPLGIPDVAA
jgi:hypothetical protein